MNKGFEQLRVAVAYPGLNVKIVGTHSGISHRRRRSVADEHRGSGTGVLAAGFTVLAPSDEISTKALVRAAAEYQGPVFIRTGR